MPSSASTYQTLLQLIDDEIAIAHQLGKSLADENEALRRIDPAELDRVTDIKQRCIESLAACDAQRHQLCRSLGFETDRAGMEALLSQADKNNGQLLQRWNSLLALLETCREANQRNGAVVTLQRRRVTDALGLLRGEPANNAVYDAQGELGENSSTHVHAEI